MTVLNVINTYNFHDSSLCNIAYISEQNELILTIDLCNWAQESFNKGIDPDHIIGNLIFKNVQNLFIDPSHFNFYFLEILEVSCELINDDIAKTTFIVMYKQKNTPYNVGDPNFLLSFSAKVAKWIPLETYND